MEEQTFTKDVMKKFKRFFIQCIIPPSILFAIFMTITPLRFPTGLYFMMYFAICFLWTCIRIGPIEMELYDIHLRIRIKYEKLKSEGRDKEAEEYIKSVPKWLMKNFLIANEKCRPMFW
jgi:hypothetical protein